MARVTAKVDKPLLGANLQAHLDGLRATTAMRKAAGPGIRGGGAAPTRSGNWRRWTWPSYDDPLARQSEVEEAVEAAVGASGRSKAGRPGQRGGIKRRGARRRPSLRRAYDNGCG